MATLKIREFTRLGLRNGQGQIALEPGTDQTAVTFTSSSVASAAFAADTEYVQIKSDVAFCFKVGPATGATPTADQNCMDVPAETMYFMGVPPGAKMAVITKI